jgi:hypothetical protein
VGADIGPTLPQRTDFGSEIFARVTVVARQSLRGPRQPAHREIVALSRRFFRATQRPTSTVNQAGLKNDHDHDMINLREYQIDRGRQIALDLPELMNTEAA